MAPTTCSGTANALAGRPHVRDRQLMVPIIEARASRYCSKLNSTGRWVGFELPAFFLLYFLSSVASSVSSDPTVIVISLVHGL